MGKDLSETNGHCGKAFTLHSKSGDRFPLQGHLRAGHTRWALFLVQLGQLGGKKKKKKIKMQLMLL